MENRKEGLALWLGNWLWIVLVILGVLLTIIIIIAEAVAGRLTVLVAIGLAWAVISGAPLVWLLGALVFSVVTVDLFSVSDDKRQVS